MGNYTTHTMTIKGCDEEKINDVLAYMKEKQLIGYAFDGDYYYFHGGLVDFYPWDSVKWYTRESDMTLLSVKFPDMTFCVHCSGEYGDKWDEYYCKGKFESCEWVPTEPKEIRW